MPRIMRKGERKCGELAGACACVCAQTFARLRGGGRCRGLALMYFSLRVCAHARVPVYVRARTHMHARVRVCVHACLLIAMCVSARAHRPAEREEAIHCASRGAVRQQVPLLLGKQLQDQGAIHQGISWIPSLALLPSIPSTHKHTQACARDST